MVRTTMACLIAAGLANLAAAGEPDPDRQIEVEVRVVSFARSTFERIGLDFNVNLDPLPGRGEGTAAHTGGPEGAGNHGNGLPAMEQPVLNDIQVFMFLEALQGDRRTQMVHCPRLTICNGQIGRVEVSEADESARINGLKLAVKPLLSDSAETVRLDLDLHVTTKGAARSIATTLSVPAGKSVLVGGWNSEREIQPEPKPSLLQRIPFVKRLFVRNEVEYGREVEDTVVMITPRVLVDAGTIMPMADKDEPAHEVLVGQADQAVGKLLERYRQACHAGRLAEARDLATQALRLDPNCFSGRDPQLPAQLPRR